MHLEDALCQVDPDNRSLLHGRLLPCGWSCNITSVAHFDAVGGGIHPIRKLSHKATGFVSHRFGNLKRFTFQHARLEMDPQVAESERRFSTFIKGLVSVLGHADRAGPLRAYCLGLMMPAAARAWSRWRP